MQHTTTANIAPQAMALVTNLLTKLVGLQGPTKIGRSALFGSKVSTTDQPERAMLVRPTNTEKLVGQDKQAAAEVSYPHGIKIRPADLPGGVAYRHPISARPHARQRLPPKDDDNTSQIHPGGPGSELVQEYAGSP